MCGILYVESRDVWPLERHHAAGQQISRRGPDLFRYRYSPHRYAAHSVLHITGTDDFYHASHQDFFAYNGEIYDYRSFGCYGNDVELAYHAAKNQPHLFRQFSGPWAWLLDDGDTVTYASDPQGERYLYRYHDHDLVIVASDVATILCYVNGVKQHVPYNNKTWTMMHRTPWQGIERLESGRLYVNHQPSTQIDSVWDWIKPDREIDTMDAQWEFEEIWQQIQRDLASDHDTAVSFSGGVDSTIILDSFDPVETVTINMIGKDPIIGHVREFLTPVQKNVKVVDVDYQTYAREYLELLVHTHMPAQSWSFVGKWLVSKLAESRVIFTGTGADELFGGYSVYHDLTYVPDRCCSPYSSDDHESLWQRCLEAYHGDARSATLLMDYWYQLTACDLPGQDAISGAHGKEIRNPFLHQRLIKFALNLPWSVRANKRLLKNKFLESRSQELLFPKQGFAGHANDSLPWMGIDIDTSGDRYQDWKVISQKIFYDTSHTT
jgi:asparagine synthetase B (glutamine-hydrolysing)